MKEKEYIEIAAARANLEYGEALALFRALKSIWKYNVMLGRRVEVSDRFGSFVPVLRVLRKQNGEREISIAVHFENSPSLRARMIEEGGKCRRRVSKRRDRRCSEC